jgi:predicted porin
LPAIPVRDEYDRNKGNKQRESNWRIWTLTGEYFFHKNARATVTYQWRDVGADERSGVARINGNAVLNGVEQRIGIQLTLLFNRIVMN